MKNLHYKKPQNDNQINSVRHYLDDYFEDFDMCVYEAEQHSHPDKTVLLCPNTHVHIRQNCNK